MEKPVGNIGNVEERLDELFEIYGKLAHHVDELFRATIKDIEILRNKIHQLERR